MQMAKVAGWGRKPLLRFGQHPERGMVGSGNSFIQVGGASQGLIVDIGTWVLDTPCEQNGAPGRPEGLGAGVDISESLFWRFSCTVGTWRRAGPSRARVGAPA